MFRGLDHLQKVAIATLASIAIASFIVGMMMVFGPWGRKHEPILAYDAGPEEFSLPAEAEPDDPKPVMESVKSWEIRIYPHSSQIPTYSGTKTFWSSEFTPSHDDGVWKFYDANGREVQISGGLVIVQEVETTQEKKPYDK